MNKFQTFEEFLTTQSLQVPVGGFVFNLLLACFLAYLLSRIYIKYGQSLSNRDAFGRNFILITMTTMLIISIVKSSLALSLGLVGALSIVRFRAAIKEPEELSFIFLAIGIGLGLGADQRVITVVAFFIITGIIWLRHRFGTQQENQNLYLTVSSHNPVKAELNDVVETLKRNCDALSLKRFDESKELLEASFLVSYHDYKQLEQSKKELQKLSDSMKISFLDNQGIF